MVLATALLVAVSALTAVAFLTNRVSQAVELRAAESLAADLRLVSGKPLPESYLELAASYKLETARITSMPSVVFAGDANTLTAVRAVSAGYPLRGKLKTAQKLSGAVSTVDQVPPPGEAWAAASLLARLGVDTGATVEVGNTRLLVTRVLDFRPDQGWSFVDLAPTLLINQHDLASTGLIQPGSRVNYRLLFAGQRKAVAGFRQELETWLADGERLRDIRDASPQIVSAMDRAGRFLNLASLVSVLLAAVAVAMAARRYSHRHRDRIALLKCLGSSQSLIIQVSLLQLVLMALVGGLIATGLGFIAQQGLAFLLRDLIQGALPAPSWQPLVLGLLTAVVILAGFALPELWQMGKTPPLRVLRNDIGPPPLRYGLSWLAAALSIIALLLWMVQDTRLVLMIALGTGVTLTVLGACGWLLVKALQGFRSAAGAAWRYGLANIARRGRDSAVQVVAFGLGLLVLLLLTLVRNELLDNWRGSLPDNAPNQFMINIQPYEVEAMRSFLADHGFDVPRFVPLVRARLTHINGEDVTQISFEDPEGQEWATRDANLTWSAQLQADNNIIAGAWWDPQADQAQVSAEERFASELGLGIGDQVRYEVAGERFDATVSSIRTVEWDSFQPNFFMVFSPGALDSYPTTYITSLYSTADQQTDLIELMRSFPSVTVIDLDAILGQVRDVMDKSALAVQAVFLFTLLAGLTVLWAAVQATQDERRYESAMLRTLGATRRRVLAGVAAEFLAIGLLAGVLAATGASIAGWLLATHLFKLDYQFNLTLWLAGPVLGMLFVGISGMAASYRVISHAPVSVLRHA